MGMEKRASRINDAETTETEPNLLPLSVKDVTCLVAY